MTKLRAVILHKHVLFRELIELELREVAPVEIAGVTGDPDTALELLIKANCAALVVEATDGFVDRHDMLRLFCAAAESIPRFLLISANLATSEIEVLQDRVAHGSHLGLLKPLLQEVAP
jgi:DNA-binding NarL/FixJ family response regulator